MDFPVAAQNDVAGDGVVLRVVPGEGDGVVGDDGAERPVGLAGGSGAATAPVAPLLSVSSLPASSVKRTSTLMVVPSSSAARV